ncbi:MAG: S9 family peptidase, partial [Muribaculaceae bacterium]|nr:S9 family peptidase [Muribaculaceae bacterium]
MAVALTLGSCGGRKAVTEYPAAPRADVVDEYFGIKVEDPYRLLENDTSSATLAWVEAEREVTENYLSQIPFRQALKNRLTEL